jgi:formylglycine-generating enzyme required for sulfatase activity
VKFTVKITLALCVFYAAAFGQYKPKIALYIADDGLPVPEQRALMSKFLVPFTNSGMYSVIDRSDIFLQKASQERIKQRDGSVNDREVLRIGQEAGAKYVCIVDLVKAFGAYNVSARLVDVETAEIYLTAGEADITGDLLYGMKWAADKIFKQMHSKPQGAGSATSRPSAAQSQSPVTEASGTAPQIDMVLVKGGTFTMGCKGSKCTKEEKPQHSVTVGDFYIGKYEVTQKQWVQVMGRNPSIFNGDDLPVEKVSWNDVQEFIGKLNALTGKNYRLPTEAEWEYAARGGANGKGYQYSGSNNIQEVAWYAGNAGDKILKDADKALINVKKWNIMLANNNNRTHPVGTRVPNELGIYDMTGNVFELVSDWYEGYSGLSQTNPTGPASGTYRVYRGGAFGKGVMACRVSFRLRSPPGIAGGDLGFRLALSP